MKKLLFGLCILLGTSSFATDINTSYKGKSIVLMKDVDGNDGLPMLVRLASKKLDEVITTIGDCSSVEVTEDIQDNILNSFEVHVDARGCNNIKSFKIEDLGRFLVFRELNLHVEFKNFDTKMNIKY